VNLPIPRSRSQRKKSKRSLSRDDRITIGEMKRIRRGRKGISWGWRINWVDSATRRLFRAIKFKCNRSLCERDRLIRQITCRAPAMSNLLLIVFYRLLRSSVYGVYSRRISLLARYRTSVAVCSSAC